MVKRLLVTTALESTWGKGEPILFLGEWCKLFSRNFRLPGLNFQVLPYHWDDRAKLEKDYFYLRELHEYFLERLTSQLNIIHDTNHSLRYWRILVGPWLGYFIQMLFDRWESIQQAANQVELAGTIILTGQDEKLVPSGMGDFVRLFVGDEWNHQLYAGILRRFSGIPCIEQPRQDFSQLVRPTAIKASFNRRAVDIFSAWCRQTARGLVNENDCFFLNIDLSHQDEIRLAHRLGQIPQLWRCPEPIRAAGVDWKKRQWILQADTKSSFEMCACDFIPRHIPTSYLEGYRQLVDQSVELPWPKNPSLIWSNGSFNSDDLFKVWAAGKAEHGSRLVAGQHGGHYGIGRWSFNEDHEIAVSDCYFSWGWSDANRPKVKPIGQLSRKVPGRTPVKDRSGAILVTCIVPRQSYWMFSAVVARQWVEYFENQCALVENLPSPIRNSLTIRLHSEDYGWNQLSRWRERFPYLHVDDGYSNIHDLISKSKIYIATYNATTYLESFSMDMPTVIFWNPKHWELRDSAISYFDDLKRVGVFHDTPESAALHIGAIWNDVDAWWHSSEVREVLKQFTARYCHRPASLIDTLEGALRAVSAPSGRGG